MGIIGDNLEFKQIINNTDGQDDPMNLERYRIYCKGTRLRAGIAYLALAEELDDRIIAEKGSALITIGAPPEGLVPSVIRFIALESGAGLAELCNKVGDIFFKYSALERQLQSAVHEGRPIQYLLDLVQPFLGNSIAVIDPEFRLLAVSHNPDATEDSLDQMPVAEDTMIAPEVVAFFENDNSFVNAKGNRGPYFYDASIFPWRNLCMNIFVADEFAARVSVAENCHKFRKYDAELLSLLVSFIQLIYSSLGNREKNMLPQERLAEVCGDLLNGNDVEHWRIRSCLINRGWENDRSFVCACILFGDYVNYNRAAPYYARMISTDYPGCVAFEHESRITVLVNLRYYDNSTEKFISSYIEQIRDLNFRIGFSNVFSHIVELKAYYFQAETALNIGMKYYPDMWRHGFSDCALLYILSTLSKETDAKYICAPEVILLNNYDRENGGELLRTLRTYIDTGMNAVQTAKELFLHRSTMMYRLERIKELTKLDFKDPDRLLWIAISLRLIEQVSN